MVLVDIWTYSCVNWLRTLPYVSAWHERYRDRGLVVVGVHAPEFGFEHDATIRVDAGGLAEAADRDSLGSPETYLGAARGERFSDGSAGPLALNRWSLAGACSVGEESAVLEAGSGSIAYRFQARESTWSSRRRTPAPRSPSR